MAISKIVYKESANATPVTWMDATSATAGAADITAPKTAMLADGVMTTGTGSGGGGITPVPAKDVNFIDYDGTIVYSYTKAEFALLDALPANPSHDGLTAQGWNWTKNEITTQLTAMPDQPVWVGQMYVTSSGKTEIDIELKDASLLSPYLKFAVNGTAVVDWGDGSGTDTVTGTSLISSKYTPHTYAATGNYTISISVTSGSFTFYDQYILSHTNSTSDNSRRYNSSIIAVRLGTGIATIGHYAFCYCSSMQSVTIPSSVTSIGNYVFRYCYTLQSVAIPSNVTSVGNYMFEHCSSMQSVTIPSSVTSIGNSAFTACYSMQSVTIPDSVTSIGTSAFSTCSSLYKLTFKSTTPPTVANSNAFSSLPTDCIIYVPYSADHSVLAEYQAATNYPSSSTYTYVEE